MKFSQAIARQTSKANVRTENGMRARSTTGQPVLDLFSAIGSARGVDLSAQFNAALADNVDLTLRTMLWARDIREGSGERQTFRNLLAALEKQNPSLAGKLMYKVPELGRWDDLFTYVDPINRRAAFTMIRNALMDQNGLCAKWMPRKGPVAVELTKFLSLTPKQYRKLIVGLSKTVEQQMCAKEWNEINFSHVPSVASARYQKAFGRNAPEAYSAYLRELQKPEAERDSKVKINAGALYPHDVIKSVFTGNKAVADEQWKALPNYLGNDKIFPMVDVSGSMGSFHSYYAQKGVVQPIEAAVALGLYVSDKNSSDFKDCFLTFAGNCNVVKLSGTLSQKIAQMQKAGDDWGSNTNLHRAFEKLLDVALKGKVSQEDMPSVLLILSDMQFDSCVKFDDTAYKMIKRKYQDAGYNLPKIVFWNLNASYGNQPVRFDKNGTAILSGFSPSLMKSVLANDLEEFTPWNVMLQTIMKDRYAV